MNIRHNNSGIIMIVVIAVMSVLIVCAVGVGETVSVMMRYINKELARTRAMATALAGVNYTVQLISLHPRKVDSWWQSGVNVASQEEARKYFYQVVLGKDARFDVAITDETRRLNLNALNEGNKKLLSRLIVQYGFSKDQGEQVAINALEWLLKIKKAPFDDITELMMVKGMSPAIFASLKGDLTIYPKRPLDGIKVNYWTVSDKLYQALIDDLTESHKAENIQTIINIAQKYRTKEKAAQPDPIELAMMAPFIHVPTATDYQVRVRGYDIPSKISVEVVATIGKGQDGAWNVERLDRIGP